jgi:DNA-binding Xre family transcriptional regulator
MNIDLLIKTCANDNLQSELKKIKQLRKVQVPYISDFKEIRKIAIIVGSEVDDSNLRVKIEDYLNNFSEHINQEEYDSLVDISNKIINGCVSVPRSYTHYWKHPKLDENNISHLKVHPIIYIRDNPHEIKIKSWLQYMTASTMLMSAIWKNENVLAGHDRSDRILQCNTSDILIFRNKSHDLNISEGIDYIQHNAIQLGKKVSIFDYNSNEIKNNVFNIPFGIEQHSTDALSNKNSTRKIIYIRPAIKMITKNEIIVKKKEEKIVMTKAKKKKISAREEMKNIETKLKNSHIS